MDTSADGTATAEATATATATAEATADGTATAAGPSGAAAARYDARDTPARLRAQPGADGGRLASRSGLGVAIVGCLLGAGVALFASSASWVHTDVLDAATAGNGAAAAPLAVTLHGGDLAPAVEALGLLGLAASVALLATRGIGRRLVGLLVAVAGCGVIGYAGRVALRPGPVVRGVSRVVALAPSGHPTVGAIHVSAAPWVTLVGGLALVAGGALAVVFGRRWPAMGGRYQTRSARPVDAWDAIERGEDPTASPD